MRTEVRTAAAAHAAPLPNLKNFEISRQSDLRRCADFVAEMAESAARVGEQKRTRVAEGARLFWLRMFVYALVLFG
jgi:hypothetical protein